MKLEKWAGVEHDARMAVKLHTPKNPAALKSYYYLAQALLKLRRPHEAYETAEEAYRTSLTTKNSQTENLSRTLLRAKQQIWASKESARLRGMNETLAFAEQAIEAELKREVDALQRRLDKGEIMQIECAEDQRALNEETEKHIHNLREAFRIASKGEIQEKVNIPLSFFFFFFLKKKKKLFIYLLLANVCRLSRTTLSIQSPLRSCTILSVLHPECHLSVPGLFNTLNSRESILSPAYLYWSKASVPTMASRPPARNFWTRMGGPWTGDGHVSFYGLF